MEVPVMVTDASTRESPSERLFEIEALIADDPAAALAALAALDPEVQESSEGRYVRAQAVWAESGADAAEPLFKEVIVDDPGFADAHHALAGVYEELDRFPAMVQHYLIVLALDAAEEQVEGGTEDQEIAEIAEDALADVPAELRERLGNVAVIVEDRPSWDLVADGFDPRALGLCEGPDDLAQRTGQIAVMTSRIVLFAANLRASFPDPEELEEEIAVTVLHEIGHYFGLDEEEVGQLGLE
ncbi:MAG: metallopeptidase family protein [Nannocystaceae bacterium]